MDVDAAVTLAIQNLTGRSDRDPATGKFTSGNTAAGTTLERSERLRVELEIVRQEIISRMTTAFELTAEELTILVGPITAASEAAVLRSAMAARLADESGPVSGKGRVRALYNAWASAVDRELRTMQAILTMLGLLRKPTLRSMAPASQPPMEDLLDLKSLSTEDLERLAEIELEREKILKASYRQKRGWHPDC
jgi:hypothetical protein